VVGWSRRRWYPGNAGVCDGYISHYSCIRGLGTDKRIVGVRRHDRCAETHTSFSVPRAKHIDCLCRTSGLALLASPIAIMAAGATPGQARPPTLDVVTNDTGASR